MTARRCGGAGAALATLLCGALGCAESPLPSLQREQGAARDERGTAATAADTNGASAPDAPIMPPTAASDASAQVEARAKACRDANASSDPRARHVVAAACSDVASLDIPGLVLLVREGDDDLLVLEIGTMDLAGTQPVRARETAFRIGSITKVVTSWLALEAAERGELELDAPLAEILGELHDTPAGGVTLRELLAHRSGLPELEPRDLWGAGASTWLTRVATFERARAPGFAYRNLDHALVGAALVRATDTTWPALVDQRAGPSVGLDLVGDLAIEERTSPGHPRWPGSLHRMTVTNRAMLQDGPLAAPFTQPAGGLVATADALARFALAITTEPSAPRETRKPAGSLQVSARVTASLLRRTSAANEPCWTLGFACIDRGATRPPVLRHAGNTGDTSTELWVDPGTRRVVVVVANVPEPPHNATLAAAQRYLGLDAEALRMAYTVPSAAMSDPTRGPRSKTKSPP